jgi:choline dehydrogenase-like flavoprotein
MKAHELGMAMNYGPMIVPQDLTHLPLDKTEVWEQLIRRYATTLYHPSSTCRMGEVVDADLRVIGTKGLRVADASIFPHVTSGNTNAPAIMVRTSTLSC